MERSPLKGVENTRHELQDKNYKKLYHELVERHGILQSQLESYNSLFKKFGKIKHLKVQCSSRCARSNSSFYIYKAYFSLFTFQ